MPTFRTLFLVAAMFSGGAARSRSASRGPGSGRGADFAAGHSRPDSTPGLTRWAFTDELARGDLSPHPFPLRRFLRRLRRDPAGRRRRALRSRLRQFLRVPKRETCRVQRADLPFRVTPGRIAGCRPGVCPRARSSGQSRQPTRAPAAAMEGSQQQAFLNAIAAERELTVVATATTAGALRRIAQWQRRLCVAADPRRICADQPRQVAALRLCRPRYGRSRPR